MPEIQDQEFGMKEFKFPDEVEADKKVSVEAEGDDINIEIEDDTPPEDRGREPMPKEIVKKLEEDELDKYSEEAKQKLNQLKKVWHDERRAKEAAAREREEAIRVAQQLLEENKKLKAAYSSGEQEYISTVKNAAELQLEVAKRGYKEALETGDSERIADAQLKLNEASYKSEQVKNFKPTALQEQEKEVQIPQLQEQAPQMDAKTQEWTSKNPWFGPKKSMTAFALGLHEELIEEYGTGFAGTDAYFQRIDKAVRKSFPDYFEVEEQKTEVDVDAEPQRTEQKQKPSTVVAPATRSTSSKQIKLTTRQVALARKLGITPEQYAREFIKTGGR